MFKYLNIKNKNGGFTLIELIVVIALSAGVFVLASGIFVQSLKIQRRAFFIQRVQENIGFTLESMAKEIRVSSISTPSSPNCPASPYGSLSIIHPVNGAVEYLLEDTDLHRRLSGNGVDTVLNSVGALITRLGFCVSGNTVNDQTQPRVTILLTVSNGSTNPDNNITIDMQTTVSQRLLSD